MFGICLYQLFICLVICGRFVQKLCAHFETCSQRVSMSVCRHCYSTVANAMGAVTRGKRVKKPTREPRNRFRVIGSWTTNTAWLGPTSRVGRPTPSRDQIRHAPSRNAAQVKCQLCCRTLRQTVRQSASRLQIRKAPTVITLPVSEYGTSKSRRDAARLVKLDNLTVQFDI